jgi:hypothetical protein
VALELAFRELDLDTLPAIQPNNGMATRTSVSHFSSTQTSARDPRLPDATKSPSRTAPGIKLREHGLNEPKVNQTEGLRNPHSVTRPQPNQPPARNPPLSEATKSLQSRGDRDQAPIKMAIHIIKENNRSGVPRTGPTTSRDIHTPRADGKTAAQDEWP